MKKLNIIFVFLLVSAIALAQVSDVETFMKQQPQIVEISTIPGNDFFNKTYGIMVRQPLDHSDTTKGFFLQRVFVADKGKDNDVLLITEGYSANYAASPRYLNELCTMFQTSQITVEHRYFGQSWPDPVIWDYLTVQNAAADHHAVVEIFKKYYTGKWINTGISKGGQTAVYHRTYYPDDVDVTVAYVAPLNFGVEDGRHEPFLQNVSGTAEQRKKIKDFQIEILKNRAVLVPKIEAYSKEKNYTYRISYDEVLDYCVLEYPYAFWQYGRFADKFPAKDADINTKFNHLIEVSSPSYFAIEDMEKMKSFFVQAARELGYYGYDIRPFKKYLSIKTAENYLPKIFLPAGLKIEYNKNTALEVKKFINTTDAKIIFIYGGFDPWYASGFEVPEKSNLLKIVKPGGSHSTRIGNLPPEQKNLVVNTLEKWLEKPVSAK